MALPLPLTSCCMPVPNVVPGVPGFADPATQWTTLLIYAIILAAVAMLNIFGVRIVAFLMMSVSGGTLWV